MFYLVGEIAFVAITLAFVSGYNPDPGYAASCVSELVGEGWSIKETDAGKNGVFVKGNGNAVISVTRSSHVTIQAE